MARTPNKFALRLLTVIVMVASSSTQTHRHTAHNHTLSHPFCTRFVMDALLLKCQETAETLSSLELSYS